jgi:hypothetical protein
MGHFFYDGNNNYNTLKGLDAVAFEKFKGFSISGWFFCTGPIAGSYQSIVSKVNIGRSFYVGVSPHIFNQVAGSTGASSLIFLINSANSTFAETDSAVTFGGTAGSPSSTGPWHFFMAVHYGPSVLPALYVWKSGIYMGYHNVGSPIPSDAETADVYMARHSASPAFLWNGGLADIAFWGIPLTRADAASMAFGAKRPGDVHPEALLAWYKLEDSPGALRIDSAIKGIGIPSGTTLGMVFPALLSQTRLRVFPKPLELLKPQSGSAFITGWSRQSNLPVIGGGTF